MPLYIEIMEDGTKCFIHGRLGPHCTADDCAACATHLCDFPVGKNKTCDRKLCRRHITNVAPDTDYCAAHHQQFRAFEDAGGVKAYLENIVPFKKSDRT